jgi:hypothetical protein
MSVPFVVRRAEMEALGHAVRGAHRLVVVTGDAGVGKTRLVAGAAREGRGWRSAKGAIERAVALVDAVRHLGVGGQIAAAYVSQRRLAWVAVWAGDPRGALD